MARPYVICSSVPVYGLRVSIAPVRVRDTAQYSQPRKLMSFVRKSKSAPAPASPEALFHDLRGRTVQGLLSHQADVLREYTSTAAEAPDVALELPTGSGKTLVGLLIGEWRRRARGERVVYLCPTKQLVHQVVAEAKEKYGITAVAFTGKKRDYPPSDRTAYISAQAVAVTTYSALFNTAPFFEDAQVIVVDDAHASENYIAAAWSLSIDRRNPEHRALFDAIAARLKAALRPTDFDRLVAEEAESRFDESWVESIPLPALASGLSELEATIDANVSDAGDLRYSWQWLKGHLEACHLYIARGEILIRPLIPPSGTHEPFARARQRIYMSATLGSGGDLERVTGRPEILRLPVPAGWDQRGLGRRFFIMPTGALSGAMLTRLAFGLVERAGRAVVLTTSLRRAAELTKTFAEGLHISVFGAREIERSKADFLDEKMAVAILANRFDGIDFPDDQARILFIDELPNAANLQERFFSTQVGANLVLRDRVLTRIVQGFGRCTRGPTDRSAVVVIGDSLFSYLARRDERAFFHPELQAELEFGLENSQQKSIAEILENFGHFLAQDEEWDEADRSIIEWRDTPLIRLPLPGSAELRAAVDHEVAYQYALWRGSYLDAVAAARRVLAAITAPELRGYRALWLYLEGNAAYLAQRHGHGRPMPPADELYASARKAGQGSRWLSDLPRYLTPAGGAAGASGARPDATYDPATDPSALSILERLEVELERVAGPSDAMYLQREAKIRKGLTSDAGEGFEAAHEHLGRFLGYDAGKVEADASPDPWWRADSALCFVFEDHAAAEAGSRLDATKARQAATHANWVRERVSLDPAAEVIQILITPVSRMHAGAEPHVKTILTWPLSEFREWAARAIATVTELRKSFPGPGDLAWRGDAVTRLAAVAVTPQALLEHLHAVNADVKWTVE